MSNIEWTDETWNPLAGCTRASEGCDNCYAAVMSWRLGAMAKADIAAGRDPGRKAKYIGVATRNGHGVAAFNGKINLDYEALTQPRRWKKPRMIFVNSMSDLFHHNVPDSFVARMFEVMAETPRHTYQVLTKRPERMAAWCKANYSSGLPLNVWVGTSVENQKAADERVPHLIKIAAWVRFLSCEPLLGPVNLDPWLRPVRHVLIDGEAEPELMEPQIGWAIVGGESGPRARPMHPRWAQGLRDQCQEAGAPFFFKQWGEWIPMNHLDNADDYLVDARVYPNDYPADMRFKKYRVQIGFLHDDGVFCGDGLAQRVPSQNVMMMYRVGKKAAGRLLDGREWNEFPTLS